MSRDDAWEDRATLLGSTEEIARSTGDLTSEFNPLFDRDPVKDSHTSRPMPSPTRTPTENFDPMPLSKSGLIQTNVLG